MTLVIEHGNPRSFPAMPETPSSIGRGSSLGFPPQVLWAERSMTKGTALGRPPYFLAIQETRSSTPMALSVLFRLQARSAALFMTSIIAHGNPQHFQAPLPTPILRSAMARYSGTAAVDRNIKAIVFHPALGKATKTPICGASSLSRMPQAVRRSSATFGA